MFLKMNRLKVFQPSLFRKNNWFGIIVVFPTILVAIYYALFASDIYISRSAFVIKSVGQRSTQATSIASLIQGGNISPAREQAYEVEAYMRSRDALNAVQKRVNLVSVYGNSAADAFARYPGLLRPNRLETLYDYYGKMNSVNLNADTGLVTLETRAFAALDAQAVNRTLLDLGEQLVNQLNERAQRQAVAENVKRVAAAEQRMRRARIALSAYRNQTALIDPSKQAAGDLEVANQLVSTKAGIDAQLQLMRRVTPGNPSIPTLQSRSEVLASQIAAQQGKVVGTSGNNIAHKLGDYENLLVEQEFATQALSAAKVALEQSDGEAAKQQFYLERVVAPDAPDMAALPNRWRSILTVAAALTFLYLIGWMFIAGILEHAPD